MPTINQTVTKIIRPGETETDKLPVLADGTVTYKYRIDEAKHIEMGWVRIEFYDKNGNIVKPNSGTIDVACANNDGVQWFNFDKTGQGDTSNMAANTFGPEATYTIPYFTAPMRFIRVKVGSVTNAMENVLLPLGGEASIMTAENDIGFNLPSVAAFPNNTKVNMYLLDGPNEEPAGGATPLNWTVQERGGDRQITLGDIRGLTNFTGTEYANGPGRTSTAFIESAAVGGLVVIMAKTATGDIHALLHAEGPAPAEGTMKYLAMDLVPQVPTQVPDTTFQHTSVDGTPTISITAAGNDTSTITTNVTPLDVPVPTADAMKDGIIYVYKVLSGEAKPGSTNNALRFAGAGGLGGANTPGSLTLDELRALQPMEAGDTIDAMQTDEVFIDGSMIAGQRFPDTTYLSRDVANNIYLGLVSLNTAYETSTVSARIQATQVTTRPSNIFGFTALAADLDNAGANTHFRIELPNPGTTPTNGASVASRPFLRYTVAELTALTAFGSPADTLGDNGDSAEDANNNNSITRTITVAGVQYTVIVTKDTNNLLYGYIHTNPVPNTGNITFQEYWETGITQNAASEYDYYIDIVPSPTSTRQAFGDGAVVEQIPSPNSVDHMKVHVDVHGT